MHKGTSLRLRIATLFLSALALIFIPAVQAAPASGEGSEVRFSLAKAGFVTLAIDDAEGKRVRNLIGQTWLEAGPQVIPWDGMDDAGEPVLPGNYRWKGLVHDGVTSEFAGTFNAPGTPPWLTAEISSQRFVRESGAGGWLSDHGRPNSAYSDGEHIYFGSAVAEAGHSIMELDQEGRKRWGTLWLGLSGADAIFRKDDVLYVAGEKGWMKDALAVHRLNAVTYKLVSNPPGSEVPATDVAFIKVKSDQFADIKGMVVTDKYVILSLGDKDRLVLFDVVTGKYLRDVPLPGAGAIARPEEESLLAISGTNVVRVNVETGATQIVVGGGLSQPGGLAVSSQGNILVSDVAKAEQRVKVFSSGGVPLKAIGKPGGHREGVFDPGLLNNPRALAVDGKDQVWIGEDSFLPKRISVWTMDGRLLNSWTGPPDYGGGGTLDPSGASRGFYNGMAFAVAPWPDASQLRAILFDPRDHEDLPYPQGQADKGLPQAPVYLGERLYLLNDQGYGVKKNLIGEVVADKLVPRAVFGSLNILREGWKERHPEYVASLPADLKKDLGIFLWQDVNGDGKAEPAEVQIKPEWKYGAMWAMRSWPTLNLYARSEDGQTIMELAPESGKDQLSYRMENAKSIPLPTGLRGVTALSPDLEGNLLINTGEYKEQGDPTNMFYSVAPNGRINWTYPNPYPANWHNSPRLKSGQIQHTLNVEGIVPLGGDRGSVFQLNGNKGVRFLLTTDGLFVAQLFADMRNAPTLSSVQNASRGLRLDTYSLGDECFFGWFGKCGDAGIFQVLGKDSSNVMRVRGLETLQRLTGGDLRLDKAAEKQLESEKVPTPVEAIQIAALAEGWEEAKQYPLLEADPSADFAIGYVSKGMTLSVTVKNSPPFANSGDDPKTLFKSGSAVDFRISTADGANRSRTTPVAGDMRFLFSQWRDKPVAVRYRFVVPDTQPDAKSTFSSPTGTAEVDEVSVVEEANVKIEEIPDGWHLTAFLPWTALGLEEPPQRSLLGDVGLILADPEGTRAVARHYYFDRGSQVVSDLPSEVRVDPSQWGEIKF
jgi:hypothetical protein